MLCFLFFCSPISITNNIVFANQYGNIIDIPIVCSIYKQMYKKEHTNISYVIR